MKYYHFRNIYILCKESVAFMKKSKCEILIYVCILRHPKFIFSIFTMIYVCIYKWVYIGCVCVTTIASKSRVRLGSIFKYINIPLSHCFTNCIDFSESRICSSFPGPQYAFMILKFLSCLPPMRMIRLQINNCICCCCC